VGRGAWPKAEEEIFHSSFFNSHFSFEQTARRVSRLLNEKYEI
jgi:hypothetical protein